MIIIITWMALMLFTIEYKIIAYTDGLVGIHGPQHGVFRIDELDIIKSKLMNINKQHLSEIYEQFGEIHKAIDNYTSEQYHIHVVDGILDKISDRPCAYVAVSPDFETYIRKDNRFTGTKEHQLENGDMIFGHIHEVPIAISMEFVKENKEGIINYFYKAN